MSIRSNPTGPSAYRFGNGNEPTLEDAAKVGNIPCMREQIALGDDELDMALYYASSEGQTEAMDFLLNQGAKLNGPKGDLSPLYYASERGHINAMKLLLGKGANVQGGKEGQGETPLHAAAKKGEEAASKLLLSYQAKVNSKSGGPTPLHLATREGQLEIMKLLITEGAEVNAPNVMMSDETPLKIAIEHGNIPAMRLLLDRGANPNTRGQYNNTLLERALLKGSMESVETLIEYGADWTLLDAEKIERIENAIEKRIIEDNLPAFMALNQATGANKEENASVFNGRWNPIHRAMMQAILRKDKVAYFDDLGDIRLRQRAAESRAG